MSVEIVKLQNAESEGGSVCGESDPNASTDRLEQIIAQKEIIIKEKMDLFILWMTIILIMFKYSKK